MIVTWQYNTEPGITDPSNIYTVVWPPMNGMT